MIEQIYKGLAEKHVVLMMAMLMHSAWDQPTWPLAFACLIGRGLALATIAYIIGGVLK